MKQHPASAPSPDASVKIFDERRRAIRPGICLGCRSVIIPGETYHRVSRVFPSPSRHPAQISKFCCACVKAKNDEYLTALIAPAAVPA